MVSPVDEETYGYTNKKAVLGRGAYDVPDQYIRKTVNKGQKLKIV